MGWPLAVAAIAGSYLNYRGQKKQADAGGAATRNAENARQQAVQALSPQTLAQLSDWLFPGLLQGQAPALGKSVLDRQRSGLSGWEKFIDPKGRQEDRNLFSHAFGGGNPLQQPQQGPPPNYKNIQNVPNIGDYFGGGMLPGRAQGGPVKPGQPYMVGEQGPEIMVPQQQGTVLPNQQSAAVAPGMIKQPAGLGSLPNQQTMPTGAPSGPGQISGQQPQGQAPGGAPNIPGLAVQRTGEFLQNPGQTQDIFYQRGQEQANQQLNTQIGGIMGGLSGAGFDPNSGLGQMLMQSAVLNAGNQRNEYARDQSLVEEDLRRQDIQAGTENYLNFLQTLFNLAGLQSGAASGVSFPQTAPINPYSGLATGISTTGYLLSQANRNQNPGYSMDNIPGGFTGPPRPNPPNDWRGIGSY